ncbi:hypothetical protein MWU78_06820 [Arenibacter sp. F26102]|uniref:hypothetical protein n=1 Tax=Arenibacter sp. F26102 TaxID=2926416 RepID=UPI001FF40851|nr:hypothetical protein [Arenibacter sp. F26102]MCK0145348.1 hypothetical protein [Arenibacter sp. F26102]
MITVSYKMESKSEINRSREDVNSTILEKAPSTELSVGCYGYNDNGNLIVMDITEIKDSIKASLDISYNEKDANHGTFSGKLKGNKLIGTHTFSSEGMVSKRKMAFLLKDGQLIEGFGELNETGTDYKNIDNIQYTSKMPLLKMDCKN